MKIQLSNSVLIDSHKSNLVKKDASVLNKSDSSNKSTQSMSKVTGKSKWKKDEKSNDMKVDAKEIEFFDPVSKIT